MSILMSTITASAWYAMSMYSPICLVNFCMCPERTVVSGVRPNRAQNNVVMLPNRLVGGVVSVRRDTRACETRTLKGNLRKQIVDVSLKGEGHKPWSTPLASDMCLASADYYLR